MIKKIKIGEKYQNINNKVTLTYTALHVHEDVLFYFWESATMSGHSCMSSGVFMDCVNEIPEAQEASEEWFEVLYFRKVQGRPRKSSILYKSKEDFLSSYEDKEDGFHWIKLTKVEL